jgi:hypothetical protein
MKGVLAMLLGGLLLGAAPAPETAYQLSLVWLSGTHPAEFIFVVGGVGFKTVAALEEFLGGLPAGSKVEWDPGCRRMGGEPILSSEKELEAFKKFCADHKLQLHIIPSG